MIAAKQTACSDCEDLPNKRDGESGLWFVLSITHFGQRKALILRQITET